MEILLTYDPPPVKEAWHRMQEYSKTFSNHPPPPIRITLAQITAERVELYLQVTPLGDRITIETFPSTVDDSISSMDNIK